MRHAHGSILADIRMRTLPGCFPIALFYDLFLDAAA
jgi:hypothetical protein